MLFRSWVPASLEVRADSREITGRVGYLEKGILSRGNARGENERPLGEVVRPKAYDFSIRQAEDASTDDDIFLQAAHDQAKPLASVKAGSLRFKDTAKALTFVATVVNTRDGDDTLELIDSGIATGLSVGFALPPQRRVPDAVEMTREPTEIDGVKFDPVEGVPGADIRIINQALLFEISVVSRPTFRQNKAQLRTQGYLWDVPALAKRRRSIWLHPLCRCVSDAQHRLADFGLYGVAENDCRRMGAGRADRARHKLRRRSQGQWINRIRPARGYVVRRAERRFPLSSQCSHQKSNI